MREEKLTTARLILKKALNDISSAKSRLSESEKQMYRNLCADTMKGTGVELSTDYSVPCMVNANFEAIEEKLGLNVA
ncbi:hypothetical protein VCHA53O466_50423 [Vibrio chagasii]|nr:hypothetical protein VCHA53O466_50423 [Vibrio chagasii]